MWKVMVADDETYMLEAMEKLIDWKRLDCQLVYKAKNGQELLEQIKRETPDIVITDIKMPLLSGIQVAQYIYEHMIPTKVIILTAYADFESSNRRYGKAVNAYNHYIQNQQEQLWPAVWQALF